MVGHPEPVALGDTKACGIVRPAAMLADEAHCQRARLVQFGGPIRIVGQGFHAGGPELPGPVSGAILGEVRLRENTVLTMRRTDRHIVAAMRSGAFVLSERRGGGA